MEYRYAARLTKLKASPIRAILDLAPEGLISFAGGLPASELFPYKELEKASNKVFEEDGKNALQYGSTLGVEGLRDWIANRMNGKLETCFSLKNILITNGGQQGIELLSRIVLDEGDCVLVEETSFLSAFNCFRAYGAKVIGVQMDEDGMNLESLNAVLAEHDSVKMVYIIPDFQNPSTRVWSDEKRKKVVEIANEHNIFIIEDNPYYELNYCGETHSSLSKYDQNGLVVSLGSFSKILCPGLRIGWAAGNIDIISKMALAKQGMDLQSNSFTQRLILTYLLDNNIDVHIQDICNCYIKRRNVMEEAMKDYLAGCISYKEPQGGLFLWAKVERNDIEIDVLLKKCMNQKVAFIPGKCFLPDELDSRYMRLNFSSMPEDKIIEGIKRMGNAIERL